MTVFRSLINIPPPPFSINHEHQLLLVGSCFTRHIGSYLTNLQFKTLVNPYGICYNPVSIAAAARAQTLEETGFFEYEGVWRHWDLHSEWAQTDLTTAQATARQATSNTAQFLINTDVLMVTLGTAEVFSLVNQNRIVANCHKMPAKNFNQKRLDINETFDILSDAFLHLQNKRPNLKIILTVSPVRHLRMGAIENQRSKSVLLLACEKLTKSFPNSYYFPAYELLMDDLRDYRFYENDLVHPSTSAIEYIQSYFSETFFQKETITLNSKIVKINQARAHRPFNPNTPQHKAFVSRTLEQIKDLESNYPQIQFQWNLH